MNNNRLKFRVWDKAKKEYRLDIGLNQDGSLSHLCGDPEDDFTVERCTGAEDKNGDLIYEGDIIQMITGKHRGDIYAVWSVLSFDLITVCHHSRQHEIIGNIHEEEGAK